MYENTATSFTLSKEFTEFVKQIITELNGSQEKTQVLQLLTTVCQTLGMREIMWSPPKNNPSTQRPQPQQQGGIFIYSRY